MAVPTRVQMKLQADSGSIFFQDAEDGITFHIEPMQEPAPASEEGGDEGETSDESRGVLDAATTDLVRSFLRQHLLKNGENSHDVTPLMRRETIAPLLNAAAEMHLRKSAADAGGGCDDVAAALSGIYKTLGTLVSTLQQREKALKVARDMVKGDAEG